MATVIADLISKLRPDAWREKEGFSPEMHASQKILFESSSEADHVRAFNDWLVRYQPCVFGRVAARLGTISYCILTDQDLRKPDEVIQKQVQNARAKWKALAYEGRTSAFIIAVISPTIANATPDDSVLALASRLCQLYLLSDAIVPGVVYTDQVELEVPAPHGQRKAIVFDVGVNYFSAQGDKRWWQDHRFPGGLSFSMNAVGHLVKSGVLSRDLGQLSSALVEVADEGDKPKLESLGEALVWAMRTIDSAAETLSGRATQLLPLNREERVSLPACPVTLPRALESKNYCTYAGYYHTDVTLPEQYFRPDIARPSELGRQPLDFTYLFDNRLDNPAYSRIGSGVRVRGVRPEEVAKELAKGGITEDAIRKRGRSAGRDKT